MEGGRGRGGRSGRGGGGVRGRGGGRAGRRRRGAPDASEMQQQQQQQQDEQLRRQERHWLARAAKVSAETRDALIERLQFFCDGGLGGYRQYSMRVFSLRARKLESCCVWIGSEGEERETRRGGWLS